MNTEPTNPIANGQLAENELFFRLGHSALRDIIRRGYTIEYRRRWELDFITKLNDKDWILCWKPTVFRYLPDPEAMKVVHKVDDYEIVTDGKTYYKRNYVDDTPKTMELNAFEEQLINKNRD